MYKIKPEIEISESIQVFKRSAINEEHEKNHFLSIIQLEKKLILRLRLQSNHQNRQKFRKDFSDTITQCVFVGLELKLLDTFFGISCTVIAILLRDLSHSLAIKI